MAPERPTRIFSLQDAIALLPAVQAVTSEAVAEAEQLVARLEHVPETDPEHQRLSAAVNLVIAQWAQTIEGLGLEANGLWLVDFDNGDGYYCWRHPEGSLTHYHGYTEGFAGRMKIV